MVRTLAIGLFSALLATSLFAQGGTQSQIFPFTIHQLTLDNGLKIVSIPFDSPGIIAYYTVVRTGSRNELEPGKSGFAHFFEHMMFRGTKKYSEDQFNGLLKSIGADNNAYTSDDETVYQTVASSDALETIVDMESDRFMNLTYDEEAFKTEAGSILGEYNKSSSNPFQTIEEKVRDAAFRVHTYKHTTIGFLKDIEDMPNQYQYSLTFFDRWYKPENCVVVVVGDFDQEKLTSLMTTYYGPWKRGTYAATIPAEPPQNGEKKIDVPWKSKTLPILTLAYHGPAFSDSVIDAAAMNLFAQVVFSQTSDLYKKLVVIDQSVEFVKGELEQNRDPGLFYVFTRIKDPKNIESVTRSILDAIENAKTTPVSMERLASIRSYMKYSYAMELDNADHIANSMAHYIKLTNDPESVNRFYALYDAVTPDDIMMVAKKYLTTNNQTTLLLTEQSVAGAKQ